MLGIFINLSKAFGTVNNFFSKKNELHGVTGKIYSCCENYLRNRKQCVAINDDENTSFQDFVYGLPQVAILGPLLLILYINDLKKISNALDPKMFADDTNLIISDKIVHILLTKTNLELQKMIQWFKANELSPCLSATVKTA